MTTQRSTVTERGIQGPPGPTGATGPMPTPPTGTGVVTVSSGAWDGASKLIDDSLVAPSAAIARAKCSGGYASFGLDLASGSSGAVRLANAASVRAAIASLNALGGGELHAPWGTYDFDPGAGTPIAIGKQTLLKGRGGGKSIWTWELNDIFLDARGNDISVTDLELRGNGGAAQIGLQNLNGGAGVDGFRVDGLVLRSIGLYGLWCAYQPTALQGDRLFRVEGYNCGQALRLQKEYITAVDCIVKDNTLGVYVVAGNLSWTGGEITSNTTGMKVFAGGNDSHGSVTGTKINHNVDAIVDEGSQNGMQFSGGQLFDGNIRLTNSKRYVFSGTTIAPVGMYFDGSVAAFLGATFGAAYAPGGVFANAIHSGYNGHASIETYTACAFLNGTAYP